MYQIHIQFLPPYDFAWVLQLNPDDPIYTYDTEEEANAKAEELQNNDPEQRMYRVVKIS